MSLMKNPRALLYSLILFLILLILSVGDFNLRDEIKLPFENIIKGKAKITDGDTVKVNGKKIRLSGIDAPESYYRGKKQTCYLNSEKIYCGDIAKKKLIEKIKNNSISCKIEKEKDAFNRFLGECFLENESLSKFMVRSGYAFDFKKYSKNKYAKDEKYAKDNKLGFWKTKFEYPWVWRDKVRSNIIKE